MFLLILFLSFLWLLYLLLEKHHVTKARSRLSHVIHVNGTRGKSSTCRLIEAGLRAGNYKVYCKTTGTDPMTIDVSGVEKPILRRGRTNIKEQIRILCEAAKDEAEILVVECMALHPELQATSQHQILKADIGVITNVRRDHTDVMGETLPEICEALCNTIPKGGTLFTGEQTLTALIKEKADQMNTSFFPVSGKELMEDFDFPDNIALALSVCEALGVSKEIALTGMRKYKKDPYSLALYRIQKSILIDGFSINDIQSIQFVWDMLKQKYSLQNKKLTLLINNREDRGSRTKDMLTLCLQLKPSEIWLLGASQSYMKRNLLRHSFGGVIRSFHRAEDFDFTILKKEDVVLATGNIAGQGRALIARIRKEGKLIV